MLALMMAAAVVAPVPIAGTMWFSDGDYSDTARRAGMAGTVWYRLAVDSKGRVKGCTILQGTWSPRLDSVACDAASRRARFQPARDADGNAVDGSFDGPVNFTLAGSPPSPNAGHVVRVEFDRLGRVTQCIVKPMMPNAMMPDDVHKKCDRQGNAGVFFGFLDRPTRGLRWAEIRTVQLPEASHYFDTGFAVRNVIAEAEFQTLETGEITKCEPVRGAEITKPPASRIDLCVIGGLAPTATADGRKVRTRRLVIDAVGG
ncbi:energy transducer TonB [Sandarakinorhabdus sp. DWP1-3-1]|uniref:energy transducer TonB n=1 Tax=Sandarakinorhabdus sp. DWP1-3-1 TaxID=2804627 RepID=UPI003CECE3D7